MPRIQEIEARLAEIRKQLAGDVNGDTLTQLETESSKLMTERTALLADVEKRKNILASIAGGAGSTVKDFAPQPESRGNEDPYSTIEYRKAFMGHVLRGAPIPAEYRADAITKTSDITAVIPTTVLNQIVEKMESVGMILPLVTHTAYKGGISIPTSSAKPTASWVAEGTGSDKQKKATGNITFAYHKLRCAVAVTLETDTMALAAFEATLINNVTEAMTKALEQAIINGTGSGQPTGILNEAAPTGQALEASAPAYADLVNAEAALPQAYESGAVWCMSKKTFMAYAGLTDTQGQPIARVNYGIAGKPERMLLGRPVVCCDYVTSYTSVVATGTKFAFLFNFADYLLNTNYSMAMKKYEDNATDDLITKAVMLVDGKPLHRNSLVTIAKKA